MKDIFLNLPITLALLLVVTIPLKPVAAEEPYLLRVGDACHAFEHLGGIGGQGVAAAASGATIIYPAGLGSVGYEGLPKPEELKKLATKNAEYVQDSKAHGIRVALGYLCSTSIVKLERFDQNWTQEFRKSFTTPPADWLQRDRDGKPLASWYGGDYRPACMNNPDWRTYEKFLVRQTLEAGHDGIFFDNPTVHPQGCYCRHCMKKFAAFLKSEGTKLDVPASDPDAFLRKAAADRPRDFLRFRSTTAADFLAEMRAFARTIKPAALVTCNNSLNTPDSLFSQCRATGYNIYELSKAQDFVLVEDMATLSRVLPDRTVVEFGPVYEMLHAISRGKPVVACSIADGDYHTPPNLTRLAMAEAAAHGGSHLSWPTWPENVRQRMIDAIRPEADVLRQNAPLLNGRERRADALVFMAYRRWLETSDCQPMKTARALGAANVQFAALCEDDLAKRLATKPPSALVIESPTILLDAERRLIDTFRSTGGHVISTENQNWLKQLREAVRPSLRVIDGPATVRATIYDQSKRTIVHLLNLDIQRISSFEDAVKTASNVRLEVRVPMSNVHSVNAISADTQASRGPIPLTQRADQNGTMVEVVIPSLTISTILTIE
ncbi:MAG TPA: hypothetical protein VF669_07365 [Tepidisphaeraceae bacterium]